MPTARFSLLALAATTACLVSSCLNVDKMEKKIDQRTASYYEKQDKREMRAYERDKRYDDWVDRMLD